MRFAGYAISTGSVSSIEIIVLADIHVEDHWRSRAHRPRRWTFCEVVSEFLGPYPRGGRYVSNNPQKPRALSCNSFLHKLVWFDWGTNVSPPLNPFFHLSPSLAPYREQILKTRVYWFPTGIFVFALLAKVSNFLRYFRSTAPGAQVGGARSEALPHRFQRLSLVLISFS